MSNEIFLSAGDPSGDNAAARVAEHLIDKMPDHKLRGLGGPRLEKLGQEQLARPDELAVLGFWEVAKRFRFFRSLMKRCVDEIKRRKPSAVILVDYPGFNLRLARRIRFLGIPIIYYISPQIWAWGQRRVKEIRENVDLMLLILPFEKAFYADTGVRAEFVGHYLMEDIPAEYIASKPPVEGGLALLPGSRRQEAERMLPTMLEAAKQFNRKYGTSAVVAASNNGYDYTSALREYQDCGISAVTGEARRVIRESSLVLTASGTATLEAGIIGRPMVVVYKTGRITYQIARRLIRVKRIALVNLVLDDDTVPELIQDKATPARIMAELERFFTDEQVYDSTRKKLNNVPSLLGGAGASERAAELILSEIRRNDDRM